MPPTSLADLLDPDRIAVGVTAASKGEAVERVLALASGHPGVADPERLAADVTAREAVLSTGVGSGLALPHARSEAVTATVASLVTLATPVDWEAIDGVPVDLVVFFAGPRDARAEHVRLLAQISTVLSREGVRAALAAAATPQAVIDALR